MHLKSRSILDRELSKLQADIVRLGSMVEIAIEQAMISLEMRGLDLARQVIANDAEINTLRMEIENNCLRILATQQPAAGDLRTVVAAIHIAVELERMGDHALGIARLVDRMKDDGPITDLYHLPKMARRVRKMVRMGIDAYISADDELAQKMMVRDEKIDKGYNKLFGLALNQMRDEGHIRRTTFLLWIGHNLERIGDRAVNIAERVIFMATGEFVESETTDFDMD